MSSEAEAIAATTRPATVQSLTSDLRALGLADGQTVMVHASLSALGFVVGGAQAVVTALLEVVGPSGTLMMPTHSGALSDPSLWEAPPVPEAWWDTIRTNMPAYDSALTPTREMGAIVECFRHVEGVQRSGHPAVSAAAVGPNAARLVGDHSLDDGLGEGSPQARLYELDGLVLLLGVSHANNTSLHLAEYRSAAPNAARITEHAPMLIAGEHHWQAFSSLDTDEDDFAELGEAFASSGAETRAPVAAGTGRLMSARAVVDFGVEWMTVNRVRPADQSSPLMPDTVGVNDKSTAAWTSRQLSGAVGVELMGLDVRTLDDTDFARFRHALVEHHVVVVRDQSLTPSEQIDFGRRFGELDTHPFVDGSPAHPEVIDIVTEADDRANFGGGWHTDVTFLEKPDLGSILYAVELPAFGGDTLFASQHAAYDALSDLMKNMLDGLTATHSAGRQYGEGGQSTKSKAISTKNTERAAQLVEHPVVRTHPASGRKGLYVNAAFTVKIKGMRPAESDALLEFLYAHAVREAFTCRVQWQPGTLVMWDNRSVQHHALHDYAGQRRHVRRITVQGDRPV